MLGHKNLDIIIKVNTKYEHKRIEKFNKMGMTLDIVKNVLKNYYFQGSLE